MTSVAEESYQLEVKLYLLLPCSSASTLDIPSGSKVASKYWLRGGLEMNLIRKLSQLLSS